MSKRIVIIDGNSLINRAYYAMQRPMTTKDGIYTQGIYGFLNMLSKIMDDYSPDSMVVTFDRKAPTFRHKEYDQYKAGRKKMPPELAMQLPIMKEILAAMNIAMCEMDGFEADDLIGTIARIAEEADMDPLIITGDKDELQLASERTKVLITRKGISEFDLYDEQAMIDKYGFTPQQFIDFKGLMGDQSDNIPGVPGVGEKTAGKLIREYGSIEAIIAALDDMPAGKLKERLEDNQQLAMMSKRLATINVYVPIDLELDSCKVEAPDYKELIKIYEKLEFKSFLKKLKSQAPEAFSEAMGELGASGEADEAEIPDSKAVIVNDADSLGDLEKTLEETGKELLIHVFSDNSHVDVPDLIGISVMDASSPEVCYFVSPGAAGALIDLINEKKPVLSGHDIKPSLYVLMCLGLADPECGFDTALAKYVLDSGRSNYDIDSVSLEDLNLAMASEKDFSKDAGQIDMFSDNSSKYAERGCLILRASWALKKIYEKQLKEAEMAHIFHDIEMPLLPVLASMEREGICIDKDVLTGLGTEIKTELQDLETQIYGLAGHEFNINSTKQLGTVLFEELGLPVIKKTKTGYSTNADVMEKLKDKHDIVGKVLEHRTLSKLNSTYIEGLLPLVNKDGRIHAHFQQTVAATGRLSCTEPNLQNIPIRQEYGRQLRKAFIPSGEDRVFIGADYSQIELRVLAAMSGDEELIDAFNRGEDIHRLTASRVLGIPADEITFEQRSAAKAVNFGVIYGMSSFGLSTEINVTRKEAEKYIADYFKKYEKVKEFMDGQIAFCRENKFVTTMFGRRRYISEIKASNFMVRQGAERLAMNSPIQGTAADIIKIAMINVFKRLRKDSPGSKLILQIHDELIIEAPSSEAEKISAMLQEEMEKAVDINVKLLADVYSADSWYELK